MLNKKGIAWSSLKMYRTSLEAGSDTIITEEDDDETAG